MHYLLIRVIIQLYTLQHLILYMSIKTGFTKLQYTNSVRIHAILRIMINSPHQRRAIRHQQLELKSRVLSRKRSTAKNNCPLSVAVILEVAFSIIKRDGYESLTMRRLATALHTGPASLYAHVVNKADLDELLIGQLCNQIKLPKPSKSEWQNQIFTVCCQLRDQYLRYPGISKATLAVAPANIDILRISEGMLATLLAGSIEPQTAAWAIDALFLYINAYCLEQSLRQPKLGQVDVIWTVSREEMLRRFSNLPDTLPNTRRYAVELTSGTEHDRFDFAIRLMLSSISTQ
jgi:AcrR family transcriptional regulator